jgi:ribosomal protein S18 acetylase RimI-like enzyme
VAVETSPEFLSPIRTMTNGFRLRAGTREDVPAVVRLLGDLAESQGSRNALCANEAVLLRDGFGAHPKFHLQVAEADGESPVLPHKTRRGPIIVGIALYFFNYSTWYSPLGLYLEDLYVAPEWRGRGVGRALMRELARIAAREGCGRMQWMVLETNEAGIGFYESLGAESVRDWFVMRFGPEQIEKLAE